MKKILLLLFNVYCYCLCYSQAPNVLSFSPTSGPLGTTVTITGANFNPTAASNIVYFGAVRAVVTSATANSLAVTVPAGATYQPISVLDQATGLTGFSSSPFNVTFVNPRGTGIGADFYQAPIYVKTTSNNLSFVAVSDIDGDGKPDIVTHYEGFVSVLRNINTTPGALTTSSFAAELSFATGSNVSLFAVGDLDGDGKPDVVTRGVSNTVSVLRNTSGTGSISFAPYITFPTGTNPNSVAIGDLDGDGKPDLLVANTDANSFSVLRNTSVPGAISFQPKVDFATGNYSQPRSVAISDIDGDGKPDLMVTLPYFQNNLPPPYVEVYRNVSVTGSITASSFTYALGMQTGLFPYSVMTGDFNNDNKADMIINNFNSNNISVFPNASVPGGFSFNTRIDLSTSPTRPFCISIGDLDGDGKLDLLTHDLNMALTEGGISVFRNTSVNGSFSFANKTFFGISLPRSIVVGDLDADGIPEVILAVAGVGILKVAQTPLPLTLLHIAASVVQNTVQVNWQTAQENNTSHFMVERSMDSRDFSSIGSVAAAGNRSSINDYSFTDHQPLAGVNYYRLKMVDKDGSFTYSTVVKAVLPIIKNNITVFPNPVSDIATLTIPSEINVLVNLSLYDGRGELMSVRQVRLVPGNNSVMLNMRTYAAGTYTVMVSSATETKKIRMMKE